MNNLLQPLQSRVDAFKDWWHTQQTAADLSEQVKEPLYHYTDAAGLKGIIENQEIWFTSIFHLNDPSELRHGLKCAVYELRNRRGIAGQQGDTVTQWVCDDVERFVTAPELISEFGFFVASFSRAPDDLGQWRAYGDDGRGFAIGFAPSLFAVDQTVSAPNPGDNIFVAPVTYGDQATRQQQGEAITTALDYIKDAIKDPIKKDSDQIKRFIVHMRRELLVCLIWNSIVTKHDAYSSEREVRLIILGRRCSFTRIETRTRKSELVPFIRSPIQRKIQRSISKIIIGPAAEPGAEDAVKHLLQSSHIDPTNLLVRSTIPYRGR